MMPSLRFFLFVILLLGSSPAFCQELISVNFSGTVSRWNVSNDNRVFSTAGPSSGFGSLGRVNDGRIFAYRGDFAGNTPSLFQVNPNDGTMALVGGFAASAPDSIIGLAGLNNGNLLGFNSDFASQGFFEVDPDALSTTPIGVNFSNGANLSSTGSLATSPNGQIYSWVGGFAPDEGIFNKLFVIDPFEGAATEVGGFEQLSSTDSLELAFTPDGRLFGFSEINGGLNNGPLQPNSIYEFDLTTGIPSLVRAGNRSFLSSIRGSVFVSVPEPTTTPFLVLVAFAAILGRRRTKCRMGIGKADVT